MEIEKKWRLHGHCLAQINHSINPSKLLPASIWEIHQPQTYGPQSLNRSEIHDKKDYPNPKCVQNSSVRIQKKKTLENGLFGHFGPFFSVHNSDPLTPLTPYPPLPTFWLHLHIWQFDTLHSNITVSFKLLGRPRFR